MHAQILNRVKYTKYLGVSITSDLNWNKPIKQITGKVNQMLGFVKRNIKTRSQHLKTGSIWTLKLNFKIHIQQICFTAGNHLNVLKDYHLL